MFVNHDITKNPVPDIEENSFPNGYAIYVLMVTVRTTNSTFCSQRERIAVLSLELGRNGVSLSIQN